MYFIYSGDYFLLTKTINKLLKQINHNDAYEVERYSLIHDDINEIYTSLTTFSLFDQQKLIVIEDAWFVSEEKISLHKKYQEEIVYNILNNKTCNIVIFSLNSEKISKRLKIFKFVEQNLQITHVKKLNEEQLINYITTFLNKKFKKIDFETVKYLTSKVPNEMQSLTNELAKLSNLNIDVITSKEIDQNISRYLENDVFELSESFIKNDTKQFLRLYKDYLLVNDDLIGLIALMSTNIVFFRDVILLKTKGKSQEEITSFLKAHPYRIKLALKNKLTPTKLNDKIKLLYNIQAGLIDQTIDKENIAEYRFIRNMESI